MINEEKPRRVVPRWRPSWITATTPEARSVAPARQVIDLSTAVSAVSQDFVRQPIVPIAAEALFLAAEAKSVDDAQKAARFILNSGLSPSSALAREATRILEGREARVHPSKPQEIIKQGRRLLRLDYRNPVLLADIALAFTSLRLEAPAERFMRAAVALAPDSRFIVRAAARFFLHIGEEGRAHEVLRRSAGIAGDPWIQASEIAVATVRGRPSTLKKSISRALIDLPRLRADQTELASAIATVELLDGELKRAKRLFQKSIERPNDNSLAQAESVAQRLKLIVEESALETPLSFEAKSNFSYRQLRMDDAIEQAKLWAVDEPFASRPLSSLAYLFCLVEDFEQAQLAAEKAEALEDHQTSSHRLNVLFAKIQQGKLDGVAEELMGLGKSEAARENGAHILANMGALLYAMGDREGGRDAYRKAIGAAKLRGDRRLESLASAYFARAVHLHDDSNAHAVMKEVSSVVEASADPGAVFLLRRLADSEARKRLDSVAKKMVSRREWIWDAATNTLRPKT